MAAQKLKFADTYDELKGKLASIASHGEWRDSSPTQKQFRHQNGGMLNWYPGTGAINFQGNADGAAALETSVRALFEGSPAPTAAPLPPPNVAAPPAPGAPTNPGRAAGGPTDPRQSINLGQTFSESELIIGLVGAVGTELTRVTQYLVQRLQVFGYEVEQIRVSDDVITALSPSAPTSRANQFKRTSAMMDAGDEARRKSGDHAILALGVAAEIAFRRHKKQADHTGRVAYIVHSLKHPTEVERLREIYPQAFYVLGVHAEETRRRRHLVHERRVSEEEAAKLIERDADERVKYGQRTRDTFHMSDFFVRLDGNEDRLKDSVFRILDILFGAPHRTPTFDEFAMFMAFAASLRSADLSRQVGAVVAKANEILATGANDCPKFGGGLYWPEYDPKTSSIVDQSGGRDYTLGKDSNKVEQGLIVDDIITKAGHTITDAEAFRAAISSGTRISDLTEFGRMVHAEMEALLSCARNSISSRDATIYCTTFPCHNCAKHIVAAGIRRVVYVEPYPKSKALEFHKDSISLGFSDDQPAGRDTVRFEPFVGVGPRRFFDLFSMSLGSGYRVERKDREGVSVDWKQEMARLRIQMLPVSYLDVELIASQKFAQHRTVFLTGA